MSDFPDYPIMQDNISTVGEMDMQSGPAPESDQVNYRETPHNLEAEQALLGAILINNEALIKVQDFLDPEHFINPAHGKIYQASIRLIEKGMLASPVTLKPYFEKDSLLEEVGDSRYLASLAASAISIINAADYGHLIYDLAIRRELINLGEDIVNDAYEHEIDNTFKEQIEAAEGRLFSLAETGESQGGFINFAASSAAAISIIEKAKNRDGKLAGIDTGFNSINNHIGGLHGSDLMILAGRPAMGKTALATNIAFNVAKIYARDRDLGIAHEDNAGAVVAFFSLEMAADQLASRILAEQAELSSQDLRQGKMTQEEFNRLARTAQDLENIPLFIDDTAMLSIAALRTRARRLKRQHNLGFVVVDYLQLLRAGGKNGKAPENRVQEVSEITRGLKALAKELEIPVLALSQLSRTIESRDNKRPMLSDLRESGSIEQDADMVTFVYRPEYYHNQKEPDAGTAEHDLWMTEGEELFGLAEFIIGKQRHGPTGIIQLQFTPQFTRFRDRPVGEQYLPEQNE
jgi:replicative DNA helicase